MIPISEVFISRQGEGVRAGLRTLFLRVSGCNLVEEHNSPCQYPCDTDYAWYRKQGKMFEVSDIVEQVKMACLVNNINEVCLTGGEPLFHEEIKELTYWLSRWYNLSIETNGSLPIWRDDHIMWSLDIKCPSSGNHQYNNYDNLALLGRKDQVKFIVADQNDIEFAKKVLSGVCFASIVFQPSWKKLSLGELWNMLDDKDLPQCRIGTQLHKIAFPIRKKGV